MTMDLRDFSVTCNPTHVHGPCVVPVYAGRRPVSTVDVIRLSASPVDYFTEHNICGKQGIRDGIPKDCTWKFEKNGNKKNYCGPLK